MRLVNTGLGRLGALAHAFSRKKAARRITAGVLALSMVLTNVGFSALAAPGDEAQPEQATDKRVADPPTLGLDRYNEFLNMDTSTENAGRVWSDKSVFTDEVTVDDHYTYKSENGNFVEVFSAMGSSQQSSVDLMDVSPKMVFSVATSMIPFLGADPYRADGGGD